MDFEKNPLELIAVHDKNLHIYETLLAHLQSHRYAAFKSILERNYKTQRLSTNIDFIYSYPLNKSLLDVACCEGLHEFVHLLLRFGANPNKLNIVHNRGPIHFATESGYADVLKVLLEEPRTNPNLEAGRETALHFAVRKNDVNCVKVLLDHNASPNIANAKGTTPIHVAASSGQKQMVYTLLNSTRLAPDLDNSWDYRKRTPRNLIENNFSDIQLPLESKKNIDFNILRFYLDANDEEHFLENLKYLDDNQQIIDEPRLMIMSVAKNFHNAVKELIKRINNEDVTSYYSEAIQVAIKCGHAEILKQLLQYSNLKITENMVITACQELGVLSLHSSKKQLDRIKCLKIILDQPGVNVRCEDDKGNSPLQYAARAECADAVSLLLKSGSYLGHTNILGISPLSHISSAVLEQYFDECIESNNNFTDDYEINFNYTCLIPHAIISINAEESINSYPIHKSSGNNVSFESELDVLCNIASNPSLKHLLKHPLLSSYLYLKWHRIKKILYINSIFYILFYIFLNWYILVIAYKLNSSYESFHTNSSYKNTTESRTILTTWGHINGLWCFLAIFLILLFLREIFQFIASPLYYIKSFENWLEIMLIILTGVILMGAGPPISAVAILLSAWELIILIGQHPRMSTGIEMFKTVLINLTSFLMPYAFLIFAFSMSFFTLFKDGHNNNFSDSGHALFKTIIMLTGEFDANDIPFVSHPIISHFIFVLFIFLIAIVLFNLLIGLAVSDTADILNKSELVGLISRTKLISYVEQIVIGSSITKSSNCLNKSRQYEIFPCNFLARRIFFFPRYLPYGKIAVKLYKNNEIRFCGRNQIRNCASLKMDSNIVSKAKEITLTREKITENEKIRNSLEKLHVSMNYIENMIINIKLRLSSSS